MDRLNLNPADILAAHDDERLTVKQTAVFLSLSYRTLNIWRCKGGGPVFEKAGAKILYRVADLKAFQVAGRHTSVHVKAD